MLGPLLLLGPQRPTPNLRSALDTVPGDGPIVTITAGWRYDEADDQALRRAVGPDAVPLPLYAWFDQLSSQVPEVLAAWKQRQARLVALDRISRLRLHPAVQAVQSLLERSDEDADLVKPQLRWALAHVRSIDGQVLRHAEAVRQKAPEVLTPWNHPIVAARRKEATELIGRARAVLIAGGHVAVLLNRVRFFGIDQLLMDARARGTSIIAWSAGAMILTERVVLYYDDPPEGSGIPEVLDEGLGMARGCVLLPHARQRLRLDDGPRVSLLATRFAPAICIALENGAWVGQHPDRSWFNRGLPGTASVLCLDGRVVPLPGGEAV